MSKALHLMRNLLVATLCFSQIFTPSLMAFAPVCVLDEVTHNKHSAKLFGGKERISIPVSKKEGRYHISIDETLLAKPRLFSLHDQESSQKLADILISDDTLLFRGLGTHNFFIDGGAINGSLKLGSLIAESQGDLDIAANINLSREASITAHNLTLSSNLTPTQRLYLAATEELKINCHLTAPTIELRSDKKFSSGANTQVEADILSIVAKDMVSAHGSFSSKLHTLLQSSFVHNHGIIESDASLQIETKFMYNWRNAKLRFAGDGVLNLRDFKNFGTLQTEKDLIAPNINEFVNLGAIDVGHSAYLRGNKFRSEKGGTFNSKAEGYFEFEKLDVLEGSSLTPHKFAATVTELNNAGLIEAFDGITVEGNINNTGTLSTPKGTSITGGKLTNSGHLNTQSLLAVLEGDYLQTGKLKATSSRVRANNLYISGTVDSTLATFVAKNNASISGVVNGDEFTLLGKNKVGIKGEISGKKIAIKAPKEFDGEGSVIHSEENTSLIVGKHPKFGKMTGGDVTIQSLKYFGIQKLLDKLADTDPNFTECKSLHFIVPESVVIDRWLYSKRGIGISARSITVKRPIYGETVKLVATDKCHIEGDIRAQKGVTIAGRNVKSDSSVTRTQTNHENYQDKLNPVRVISREGDIAIIGQASLRAHAANFIAHGGRLLISAPNFYLGAQQVEEAQASYAKRHTHKQHEVVQYFTRLRGALGIDLIAPQSKIWPHQRPKMVLEGVDAHSWSGPINIYSKDTLESLNTHVSYESSDRHTSGRRGITRHRKKSSSSSSASDAISNMFTAKTGVYQGSKYDNHQFAPKITTDGVAKIISEQGRVFMHLGKSFASESVDKQSKSLVWQSKLVQGRYDETGIMSSILAEKGTEIRGAKGVEADIIGKDLQQASAKYSQQPETAWLKDLKERSNTKFNLVSEQHEQWRHKTSSLTPAAGAVLSIAVACLTAGAGGLLAAPALAALEIGTLATTALTAAANAAVSSLASTAAVSTVSNKGKIKSVLKDVTSSSTIRSIATGALTAGVTAGACAGLGFNVPTGTTPTVYSRIGESAVQAAAQTATGATIGREKLGDSLINALRSGAAGVTGGVLAYDIGNEYKTGDSMNWAMHKLLHAGVGAGMGALSGDPIAGAVGATVGEILGETYRNLKAPAGLQNTDPTTREDIQATGTTIAQISAATAAALTGRDPNTASTTARNAVTENCFFVPALVGTALDSDLYGYSLIPVSADANAADTGNSDSAEDSAIARGTHFVATAKRTAEEAIAEFAAKHPDLARFGGYALEAAIWGSEVAAITTACGGPQGLTPVCWATAGIITAHHSGATGAVMDAASDGVASALVSGGADETDAHDAARFGVGIGAFATGKVKKSAPSKITQQNIGRSGKQARLRELADDPKVSSRDRGWIEQEINSIQNQSTRKGRDGVFRPQKNIRVPPGKELAHRRGKSAKDGHSYAHSDLQEIDLHRLQHKHEGYK